MSWAGIRQVGRGHGMSKAKNRERAEREGTFVERQKRKDEKKYLCPFPNCGKTFWKEEGKPDCCPYHGQFILDVFFTLDHVTRGKVPVNNAGNAPMSEADIKKAIKEGKGVILVPKPGMATQAIKDAVEDAKKG
jgi:hypothetical protein